VLNFGVVGYSVQQEELALQRALAFEPDFIILQYCLNDPGISQRPLRYFRAREKPAIRLLDFVRRKVGHETDPLAPYFATREGPGETDYWARLYDPAGTRWPAAVESYERIATAAKGAGLPVLFVLFPLLLDERHDRELEAKIHAQVSDLGRRLDWTVVDLLPRYAAHSAEDLKTESSDLYHPNALGHRLAAESIHEAICDLLLGSDGPPYAIESR
jgi:lysophospholipase L1-like esterase